MKKSLIYPFTIIFLFLFISCSSSKEDSKIQVSSELVITGGGVADGKYLWVTCKGHSKKTTIFINGQLCNAIYYYDHMTCDLPIEVANRDDIAYNVELFEADKGIKSKCFTLPSVKKDLDSAQVDSTMNKSSVFVSSYGYGDMSSIWIQCENHSPKAILTANGIELNTVYYKDHLTASLPSKLIGLKNINIQVKDSLFISPEFKLKK